MATFNNPAFNEENIDILESAKHQQRTADLKECIRLETLLEEALNRSVVADLNLTSLNCKRIGVSRNNGQVIIENNKNSSIIKTGSLQMMESETPETDQDLSKREEFNRHYMKYFVELGHPENKDEFNYEYVDYLCQEADVNKVDVHGQSVMHEVAREWNTDVAYFLKTKGVDIDIEDNWGRTPLFVAVASNHIDMVRWLIENGADMSHHTKKGEGQLPLHYAAKFNTVEAFQVLMEFGANPIERDQNERTPFFIAAASGNTRICNYFLAMELPTASYDIEGESTIDHIVSNLPTDFTKTALNQFIKPSFEDDRKVDVYFSCLEKRRWKLLRKKGKHNQLTQLVSPTTLEVITEKDDLAAISHPVITQLIKLKREHYGNKFIILNNVLHILFTILVTVSASIRIGNIDVKVEISESTKKAILVITLFVQVITFIFMYKLFQEWKVNRKFVRYEHTRKRIHLHSLRPFCHPRWSADTSNLAKQKEALRTNFKFWSNGWTIIELICLFLSCIYTVITILWYLTETNIVNISVYITRIRLFYSAFFVLVVWIRLNRCFKYHQIFGAFIAMLEECAVASTQIGFLFFEFYVPLAVGFWVLFGRVNPGGGSGEYLHLNDLLYQLWLLTFIGDYDFDTLALTDRVLAQIFVGLFLVVVSIITFNIYIALLSEAFARVMTDASQRAYLAEAKIYVTVERMFPDIRRAFDIYLNKKCAPLSMEKGILPTQSGDSASLRALVAEVTKLAGDMRSSMKVVVDDELNLKSHIVCMEEKFRGFQTKYTKKASEEMIKSVRDALSHQTFSIPFAIQIKECIRIMKQKMGLVPAIQM